MNQIEIFQRLKDDFPHYAEKCLKIRTKEGSVLPFKLNRAQLYIHRRLQEQLGETGRIRALVLKGRQQGCSTYVEGRYYWRVSLRKGVQAYILTHEQAATDNLFGMAQRYHENAFPLVKPETGAANAKELKFSKLDSGYKVGTAGTKGAGRSSTIQYFHGSEVAFWPNAEDHIAGIMQAIPDVEGTEAILESTANGIGGFFHEAWQQAEAGIGQYIAVFVPWYWQPEYSKEPPEDFIADPDEIDYAEAYGLDDAQLFWRRGKIQELGEILFKQEYPATAAEAFQASGDDIFIKSEAVLKARKFDVTDPTGANVVGVDPARFGDDRTAIAWRKGRKVIKLETKTKIDTMETAGWVRRIIEQDKPDRVFVDVVGLGAGVVDRLNEMGFGDIVQGVNGGERAFDRDQYINRRAEMWDEMRRWLDSDEGVDLPDEDAIHADLIGPTYSFDSSSRLRLEKKEDMKKRGLRSPDGGDAIALTFSEPVSSASFRQIEYPANHVSRGVV